MNGTRNIDARASNPIGALSATTARTPRRSRIKLLLAGLALLTSLLGFAAPARAGNVVCLTLYYRVLGGTNQYIQNDNCYVPTTWQPEGGYGLDCFGPDWLAQACVKATLSYDDEP